MRTHQQLDARSLAMHRLIAEKIRRDPALFDLAKDTLARWRTLVHASSRPYLDAWEGLMEQGIEPCLAVAVQDSEWAAAMRQSSPFSAVLSNQERFDFLKKWEQKDAA